MLHGVSSGHVVQLQAEQWDDTSVFASVKGKRITHALLKYMY